MNIIMCRSLTYAQRASSALERAGITAMVARAPQELTNRGCGYCVKVSPRRFTDALAVLRRAGVPHGRLFREEPGGRYVEVAG